MAEPALNIINEFWLVSIRLWLTRKKNRRKTFFSRSHGNLIMVNCVRSQWASDHRPLCFSRSIRECAKSVSERRTVSTAPINFDHFAFDFRNSLRSYYRFWCNLKCTHSPWINAIPDIERPVESSDAETGLAWQFDLICTQRRTQNTNRFPRGCGVSPSFFVKRSAGSYVSNYRFIEISNNRKEIQALIKSQESTRNRNTSSFYC